MQDRELYRQILSIESPWRVERVELRRADRSWEVHVFIEHDEQVRWPCPECSTECGLHDHQSERHWRHLDTCQDRTILHARLPRSDCPEHGPRVVRLPWAEASSRFTALFEALRDLVAEKKPANKASPSCSALLPVLDTPDSSGPRGPRPSASVQSFFRMTRTTRIQGTRYESAPDSLKRV